MELENLADVIIGILVNREKELYGKYKYRMFSLQDYEEKKNNYLEIATKNCCDKKLTQEEDLIFRLIYPNKIVKVDENIKEMLIPSQMCIIRPNREKIEPIYLKWFLESELCKAQIALNVTGSSIQKISVNALRKIKIPMIDIEKQRKVKDLIELWEKEKNIMKLIIENKENLYNSIVEEIIEEEGK